MGYFKAGNGPRMCNDAHELQVVCELSRVSHKSHYCILCSIDNVVLWNIKMTRKTNDVYAHGNAIWLVTEDAPDKLQRRSSCAKIRDFAAQCMLSYNKLL
jgi:hypothetical protein